MIRALGLLACMLLHSPSALAQVTGNTATAAQNGGRNFITITQSGNGDAEVHQGVTGLATDAVANVDQDGQSVAVINQGIGGGIAIESEVNIAQSVGDGYATFARIEQGFNGGSSEYDVVILNQSGGGHAQLYQGNGYPNGYLGRSDRNRVEVTQQGGNVFVSQGGIYGRATNTTAYVTQQVSGPTGGYVTINQGSGSGALSLESLIDVNQFGDGHRAFLGQARSSYRTTKAEAVVDQEGTGHTVVVYQGFGSSLGYNAYAWDSRTEVLQSGDDALAIVYQGRNGASSASDRASIEQSGAEGFVQVYQGVDSGASSHNSANVVQDGSGSAYVDQGVGGASSYNDAFITQLGASTAAIDQLGSNNTASVSQN